PVLFLLSDLCSVTVYCSSLSLHDALPISIHPYRGEWIEFDVEQKPGKDVTAGTRVARKRRLGIFVLLRALGFDEENAPGFLDALDRKSTRLNSSHVSISYAVFCLKKKTST